MGILSFLVARGLGKRQNWARVTGSILLILGLIFPLISLIGGNFKGILGLAINGIFIYYLIFDKEVKSAFIQN